ncbi:MAG: hypothetical protein RBU25_17305 [Lentisphaeria bacterium]|jgi:hypothetical protein|nr:hypothetical protein [Lentisphaeria bacterium]
MAAELKKVGRGQRFRPAAGDWNAFVDAALAHRAGLLDVASGQAARTSQPCLVRVRNDAEADLDQFAPVILDDILISFADNEAEFRSRPPVFKAVAPSSENLDLPLAIVQQPLKDGETGRALVCGVTPAQVNIASEGHRSVELAAEGLKSADSGPARILWKAPGTGLQWAIVLLGGGGGGDSLMIAELTDVISSTEYLASIYSGWNADFSLSPDLLVESLATVLVPTLVNGAVLMTGTRMRVRKEAFFEDDGEGGKVAVAYWSPIEHMGVR